MIVVKHNENRLNLARLLLKHNTFVVPLSSGSNMFQPKTLSLFHMWGVKTVDLIHDVLSGSVPEYETVLSAYSVASQHCDINRLWLDISSCNHNYDVQPFIDILESRNIQKVGVVVSDQAYSGKHPVWLKSIGSNRLFRNDVCDYVEFKKNYPVSSSGVVRYPE